MDGGIKVADYVITYLRDVGIKKVFIVYGAAIGDLIDAFTRVKGIDYVCMMHEQSCSFAAEAYTKVTGELSCCIATSGPGGINLLNGIANCYYDSTPCLFITGQINSHFLKPNPSVRQIGFQENDIVGMSRPITKYAKMVRRAKDIKHVLDKAVHLAKDGRGGPVLVDIPMDVQKEPINPNTLNAYVPPKTFTFNDRLLAQYQINDYLKDFQNAKYPILLVGGGARNESLPWLIKRLQIPCIPTWNAIDIITSDNPYYAGRIGTYGGDGRNFAIQKCDLLLTIGSRISGRITGGNVPSFASKAKKYIVDIDRANLVPAFQQVKGDINIYCDANEFCNLLLAHSQNYAIPDRTEWIAQTKAWIKKYPVVLPEYYKEKDKVNPYVFVETLSDVLEDGDIVISDCGGNAVNVYQAFKTKAGQRIISSHGNSPMGFSFAGAIGAVLGSQRRRVVCLIGDGGFNMNIQELQTLKNYNINFKTFILNNGIYGITQQFQDTHFKSRHIACGPDGYKPPDFTRIVNAYEVASSAIEDQTNLKEQISEVVNYPEAIVCDVNCDSWHTYEPRVIGWDTPIDDMEPKLSREELEVNRL